MPLPTRLIADTLNAKERRVDRQIHDREGIPRLHVSSLIKSSAADFFCAREFVLRYMERREAEGGGIPPKFSLLYATGHFLGDYIVKEFLRRNPDYAPYAWGDWRCQCGQTVERRKTKAQVDNYSCDHCKGKLEHYVETDLFNPKKTVVGHADLIFYYEGVFYIYEFKSIDRADIIFDKIDEPLGDHLAQASNYFYMLRGEGVKVSPIIRFVYVDRSMSELYKGKPFREVYGRAIKIERLARFYKRADRVHKSIEDGVLPKRRCETIGCSRAKTCSVAISCFSRKKKSITRNTL